MRLIADLYNYWVFIVLMMMGLYIVVAQDNLIKKILGLNIFQSAAIILFISMGKVAGGTAPILAEGFTRYSNPLPHVLMLTAIVVGVATTAVALALAVRIKEAYGCLSETDIAILENKAENVTPETTD